MRSIRRPRRPGALQALMAASGGPQALSSHRVRDKIAVVSDELGLDADGLPLFPTLPSGEVVQTPRRSLARLVAATETAVLTAGTEDAATMLVFCERELIDGLAVRSGRRITGPDAIDEIADIPIDQITVTKVPTALAQVLGSYFLPTVLRAVPAEVVVPESFVRSLAKPGRRGCVVVKAGDELAFVFVADGDIALSYRSGASETGGFGVVQDLFQAPGAVVWVRTGAIEAPAAEDSVPHHRDNAPAQETVPARTDLVELVLDDLRRLIGPHTIRVETLFRDADPTPSGLRAAAESLRQRPIRLISPATRKLMAERVIAILDRQPA